MVYGTEDHAFAHEAVLELAGSKVGDEEHLLAYEFLGGVVLGDAAHDGAVGEAVGNLELEEFLHLGHALALEYGTYTDIELFPVFERYKGLHGLGLVVGCLVGLLDIFETLHLCIDGAVLDLLEQEFSLTQSVACGKEVGAAELLPLEGLHAEFMDVKAEVEKLLDGFKFREAQKEAMNLARIGNKYLADTEPWKLAKTDMERVGTILNLSLQLAANLAIAFEPFLPFSSEKLRGMLGMETFEWEQLGRTDLLAADHQLGKAELLFEKIEDSAIDAQMQRLEDIKKANEAANYKAEPVKPTVSFEDWEKLDIRVGTVLECERVPKMKKLLKFKIADGLTDRPIVSGIDEHYATEELIGKQLLFIANFAPRQFKNGLVSEGMILSAVDYDGSLAVTSLLREVKPGSQVG